MSTLTMEPEEGLNSLFRQTAHIPLLSSAEERELAARIAGGDREARDRFILANVRLVRSIAQRYVRETLPLDDLMQEGFFGLMRAVEKYDPDSGYRFSTYATWWIRQAIIRGIDTTDRQIRLPVHVVEKKQRLFNLAIRMESELGREPTNQELARRFNTSIEQVEHLKRLDLQVISLETPIDDNELTLADFLENPDAPVEDQVEGQIDQADIVRTALQRIPAREADVIRRRYGIDCTPQTLEEVGKALGVSRERIRQIEREGMKKVRAIVQKLTAKWAA